MKAALALCVLLLVSAPPVAAAGVTPGQCLAIVLSRPLSVGDCLDAPCEELHIDCPKRMVR